MRHSNRKKANFYDGRTAALLTHPDPFGRDPDHFVDHGSAPPEQASQSKNRQQKPLDLHHHISEHRRSGPIFSDWKGR